MFKDGLDDWLTNKLSSNLGVALSATTASPEQINRTVETVAANVKSNPEFYTGDKDVISAIIIDELAKLIKAAYPDGGYDFNQEGLDEYNARWSFNGLDNLTSQELVAAQQQYEYDQL